MSHYHKNTDDSKRDPLKIKVCGMNQNTVEVGALKPDYLGFIFWKPSKRHFNGKPAVLPHSIKMLEIRTNTQRLSEYQGINNDNRREARTVFLKL